MGEQADRAGQESLYSFPYHHLVDFNDRLGAGFRSGRWYPGALRYASYLWEVSKAVADLQFNSLIDIGCGDGRLTSKLAERFPDRSIVGVDVAVNALRLARCLSDGGTARFLECDISREIPEGAPFDCGTLVEVLEHIPLDQVEGFVVGLGRLVRPGGHLIVTVPSVNMNLKNVARHHQHFTAETLARTLSSCFDVVSSRYVNRRGKFPRWMQLLVSNELFALTNEKALDWLFRQYRKWFFNANAGNGLRVFAVFQRKVVD